MFATPPRVAAAFSDSPLSAIATQRKRRITVMDGYDSGHAAVDGDDAQLTNDGDATVPGEDEGDVFEVEAIIGRQGGRNGRPLEYCVRWVSRPYPSVPRVSWLTFDAVERIHPR